jgi:NAD(P)H-hydrate epimerase
MITSEEMKALESSSNLSGIQIMENSSKAFVSELKRHYDISKKKILVACYHGKNAGQGFSAADLLSQESEVDVLFIGDEEKMTKETLHFFLHVNNNPLVQFVTLDTANFDEYDFLIDAILGINIHNYLKPEIAVAIKDLNLANGKRIALDVPTGLLPDTGEIAGEMFNPELIITLHDSKPGLEQFKEKVRIVSIGL